MDLVRDKWFTPGSGVCNTDHKVTRNKGHGATLYDPSSRDKATHDDQI
jgi:hypothetical protein